MTKIFYSIKQSFKQIFRNRTMAFASVFAITAMLLILSLFFMIIVNINLIADTIKKDYDSIQVFLLDSTTVSDANDMQEKIEDEDGVLSVVYESREDALTKLRKRWGDSAYLLDSLDKNPLPNSIIIKMKDLEKADRVVAYVKTLDGIEDIKYYKKTVDRLLDATKFIQLAAIIVISFLIFVSIVVVSNTIKLTVFARQNEIKIMKYVGATNWFVRGPFLGEGMIIGVISAGVSVGFASLIYRKVLDSIGDKVLSIFSTVMVPLDFFIFNLIWIFVSLGVCIGASGSIISMRKFLKDI